ncbi:molybdopterin molybdotransferase MoeA [Helicobacter sp. 11S02629-2]|uniref:molybdopterin molybdotransferase MoeA n=1 Tax=Helicobacter sp. 11S02629-2 TaxID=1476195 RepID=UPI000BA70968|nr:molybdopterin molybdotransferase MoeA [Helicobacter sp. 11S02629-2]PAF45291.1 hypothetical protein BKH40_03590 [Helicobacter sp. 11S02629-2]
MDTKALSLEDFFKVVSTLPSLKRTKLEPLDNALNQVLSEDIYAPFALPSFTNSAMDGYCVDASLWHDGDTFKVKAEIYTGMDVKEAIKENECFLITTGAKIPESIKKPSIILKEDSKIEGDKVTFDPHALEHSLRYQSHVRLKGENVKEGALVLKKGTRLGFGELAVLAGFGYKEVSIYEAPRIAIFSSGDEVVESDNSPSKLEEAKVYDINSHSVFLCLKTYGYRAKSKGHLKDNLDEYIKGLSDALKESDVVITSAGASVGGKDYTKQALEKLDAKVHSTKLLIKPGKPFLLSTITQGEATKFILSLPGNPNAAIMNTMLLIIPILKHINNTHMCYTKVLATNKLEFKANSKLTINVLGVYENGEFSIYKNGEINSSDIYAWSANNAIATLHYKEVVQKDDKIEVILYKI